MDQPTQWHTLPQTPSWSWLFFCLTRPIHNPDTIKQVFFDSKESKFYKKKIGKPWPTGSKLQVLPEIEINGPEKIRRDLLAGETTKEQHDRRLSERGKRAGAMDRMTNKILAGVARFDVNQQIINRPSATFVGMKQKDPDFLELPAGLPPVSMPACFAGKGWNAGSMGVITHPELKPDNAGDLAWFSNALRLSETTPNLPCLVEDVVEAQAGGASLVLDRPILQNLFDTWNQAGLFLPDATDSFEHWIHEFDECHALDAMAGEDLRQLRATATRTNSDKPHTIAPWMTQIIVPWTGIGDISLSPLPSPSFALSLMESIDADFRKNRNAPAFKKRELKTTSWYAHHSHTLNFIPSLPQKSMKVLVAAAGPSLAGRDIPWPLGESPDANRATPLVNALAGILWDNMEIHDRKTLTEAVKAQSPSAKKKAKAKTSTASNAAPAAPPAPVTPVAPAISPARAERNVLTFIHETLVEACAPLDLAGLPQPDWSAWTEANNGVDPRVMAIEKWAFSERRLSETVRNRWRNALTKAAKSIPGSVP